MLESARALEHYFATKYVLFSTFFPEEVLKEVCNQTSAGLRAIQNLGSLTGNRRDEVGNGTEGSSDLEVPRETAQLATTRDLERYAFGHPFGQSENVIPFLCIRSVRELACLVYA